MCSAAHVMGVCSVLAFVCAMQVEAQARATWIPMSDSARWWGYWPQWAFSSGHFHSTFTKPLQAKGKEDAWEKEVNLCDILKGPEVGSECSK